MSLINRLEENLILPAFDLISGKCISSSLRFLLKSQNWSYSRLTDFQNERLKIIVEHAYKNVPFYRDLFRQQNLVPADINDIGDLHKLPVIRKDDFRKQRMEYYLAGNRGRRSDIRMNSSGSTGEPFTYYIDPAAFSLYYAAAIRGWYWMGYRLGAKYAKLSQNARTGIVKRIQDKILRNRYLFIRDLTSENLLEVFENLNRYKPDFIRCYPDPLYFMSKMNGNQNKFEYCPVAINTTGNILTQEARKSIEKSFGAPVYDSYSCESSAQFFEGPERDAYYASMEYAVTEIIDNENRASDKGRHITTDLWNMAMPFIRYDTQDILERTEHQSGKGPELDSFSRIRGRDSDIILTPSGKYLIVHTFTIFFEYFEDIMQFLVHQKSSDQIDVLLVVRNTFSTGTEKKVHDGLTHLIGTDVNIKINVVSDIPLLPSGKRRFIIRNESVKLLF